MSPVQCRPEVWTPPGAPSLPQIKKEFDEEVDRSLREGSLSTIRAVFNSQHNCGHDHCLHESVHCMRADALRFMLDAGQWKVDEKCQGYTALHLAAMCPVGFEMCRSLLQYGANPNCRGGDKEVPVLHDAVRREDFALIQLLLQAKANPSAQDAHGLSALDVLCRKSPVNSFCMPTGPLSAQLNKIKVRREEPSAFRLHWLPCVDDADHAEDPSKEILQMLLRHGADPLQPGPDGRLPSEVCINKQICDLLHCEERWLRRRGLLLGLTSKSESKLIPENVKMVASFL